MNTKNISVTGLFLLLLTWCTGCANWLDVQPTDRISKDQLYETESGFIQALNGLYIELNHANLYGDNLLVGTIEILAQRYTFPTYGLMLNYYRLAEFDYTTDYAKNCFSDIWEKSYALIANINTLLENAEEKQDLFSEDHYNWITGEAYALRAMLHFDLLRLFGPVYQENKEGRGIPYNKHFSLSASDLLPASKVMKYVIEDLQEAEKRLAKDPIIENGPMLTDGLTDEENFWRYRTLRLNYYAVKALQARAYLYAGEKGNALNAAREVVAVQEQWFPFLEYTQIVGNTKTPDRVFSPELLFSLQNINRNNLFTSYFTPDLTSDQMFVTPSNYLDKIFGTLARNDRRYEPIWLTNPKHENRCFYKYAELESPTFYDDLIPMIRVTEMYYIIAETSPDDTEALNSINLVLENRGLDKIVSRDQLLSTLRSEYQKEFWGEGQLFFYYKRTNTPSIPSALSNSTDVEMDAEKYVLPLPDSEINFRTI